MFVSVVCIVLVLVFWLFICVVVLFVVFVFLCFGCSLFYCVMLLFFFDGFFVCCKFIGVGEKFVMGRIFYVWERC